jgi:hypothetical protein
MLEPQPTKWRDAPDPPVVERHLQLSTKRRPSSGDIYRRRIRDRGKVYRGGENRWGENHRGAEEPGRDGWMDG